MPEGRRTRCDNALTRTTIDDRDAGMMREYKDNFVLLLQCISHRSLSSLSLFLSFSLFPRSFFFFFFSLSLSLFFSLSLSFFSFFCSFSSSLSGITIRVDNCFCGKVFRNQYVLTSKSGRHFERWLHLLSLSFKTGLNVFSANLNVND